MYCEIQELQGPRWCLLYKFKDEDCVGRKRLQERLGKAIIANISNSDDLTYHGTVLQHFETETQDLAGVEWAPNGCVLAAWDACLEVRIHLIPQD